MEVNPYVLHQKGMSPQEIETIAEIIVKAQEKKTAKIKFLDVLAYWALLAVAIIGNGLVSFTLAPFIIITNNFLLYIVLIILGAALGVMFATVVKSLEIQLHHHTLILFLVPVLAFISFFGITLVTNSVATTYNIQIQHNPATVSIFYLVAFIAPYLNMLFTKFIKNHKLESKQRV